MKRLNRLVVADPKRCVGCRICELACATVHEKGIKPLTSGNLNHPLSPRLHLIRAAEMTAPVQCRHCEDAPCARACPSHAIHRTDKGVLVDESECTGCKSCVLACPFGAIDIGPFYKEGRSVLSTDGSPRVTALKCDLCATWGEPACVASCPHDALCFVDPDALRQKRSLEAALSLRVVGSARSGGCDER